MDWKGKLSKLNGKMTKEKWLILLLLGAFFMILSFPVPGGGKKTEPENGSGGAGEAVGLSMEKMRRSRNKQALGWEDPLAFLPFQLPMRSAWRHGSGNCSAL